MTTEERFQKLEDALTVQAELVARFERKVDAWIESAEDRFAQLESFSKSVLERWDRFIQGREGNGQR